MPLLKTNNGRAIRLIPTSFLSEKELQIFVEGNLDTLLDIIFLKSEYRTERGRRIDTLGIDYAGSPVIIEFKKGRNDTVISQALSYLNWLKSQKSSFFEHLIRENLTQELVNQINLDWGSPRVICIAAAYSKNDIDAAEVIPLRLELYKYQLYEMGMFHLERVNVERTFLSKAHGRPDIFQSKQSIDGSSTTIEVHLARGTQPIVDLFETLRGRILSLDDTISEHITKPYVVYRLANNFAELHIQKSKIRIHLRPSQYDDPRSMVHRFPDTHKWTLNRYIEVKADDEVDYVINIVEQSYVTVR